MSIHIQGIASAVLPISSLNYATPQHSQNICQSDRWKAIFERVNPPRLLWDCTDVYPKNAWRYVQSLALPETTIALSPSTLETYGKVSLLPMNLTDALAGAEQILAVLPQMKISLDDIANQLADKEIARSISAFNQLLTTIDQKRSE